MDWNPKVMVMSNTIRVPLNSPAFHSYIHEGWQLIHITGLWATLRYDLEPVKRGYNAPVNLGSSAEARGRKVG